MRYNRFATEPKKKNTPGWSRKEDVQEKYDSGQVAQHEKELTELEAQVQELYGEFIDLFENEEDTLKKFIEETSSSDSKEEPKKEPELTPEDEYYIFLSGVNSQPPEFKNLNHKDTDSEAVKKKKDQVRKVLSDESTYAYFNGLQATLLEPEFKKLYLEGKYRNASLRKRASDDSEEIQKFIEAIKNLDFEDLDPIYEEIYEADAQKFNKLISNMSWDDDALPEFTDLFRQYKKDFSSDEDPEIDSFIKNMKAIYELNLDTEEFENTIKAQLDVVGQKIYFSSPKEFDDLINEDSNWYAIAEKYREQKKEIELEDLKNISKENEKIDKEIDREVVNKKIEEEIDDEELQDEIKRNVRIEENTEKNLEKVLEEEQKKNVLKDEKIEGLDEEELFNSKDIPNTEEEKIEKWLYKKTVEGDVFKRVKGEIISSYMTNINTQEVISSSNWSKETDEGEEIDLQKALTIKTTQEYLSADRVKKSVYDKINLEAKKALKSAKNDILKTMISEKLTKDLSKYFFGGSSLSDKKEKLANAPSASKFINLVKEFTKNKYKTPDTNKNVNFTTVLRLMTQGTPKQKTWATSIVNDLIDTKTDNNWNWYEKDYCRLQYKMKNSPETLTDYDNILSNVLLPHIEILTQKEILKEEEAEQKEAQKEELKKYKDIITWIKENILLQSNSTITYSEDETLKGYIADTKKKDPQDYNILDIWITNRLKQEETKEAKEQLRTNKREIDRLIRKLSKGEALKDWEIDSVHGNLEDTLKDDPTTKEAIKQKIKEGNPLTRQELLFIDTTAIKAQKPLTEKQVEILKTEIDNSEDKEKINSLKKNPEATIATNKKELIEAKKKLGKGFENRLSDFEKELITQDKKLKDKAKIDAPLSKLSLFIDKCKKHPKISQFFKKALCADKVKDFDSYQKKVLHEVYSMIANQNKEKVVARNKDRIKFLITEATKECNMRDKRENLHQTLAQYKDADGATLLDFLPNNMIVNVDDTGAISNLFSMYDNKLSDLKDKIDIQENLLEKFEIIKKKIYFDLKQEPNDDPSKDSESFIIFKKKLLALISAIALETGLRPAPVKDLTDPESGEEFGEDAGGMSYKKKLKPELTPEGKKQYEKNLIETYGIATLKPEHIKFFNKSLSANLKFYGKRGVENASKLTQAEVVKELEKLVTIASGNLHGHKSLFVLPNGKLVNNTDIVIYFESLAHKAGLKRLKITDFRKLKAVSTIHQSLLDQQRYLYKQIAKLRSVETEIAKVEIAKLVMETVDKAYKDAQKALSHSSVNETINSYVNPKLLLNFLSSGGVETAIEKALLKKTSLKFDPEVFMIQALSYTEIDITKEKNVKFVFSKDTTILEKAENSLFDKVLEMGKEAVEFIKKKVIGD
jgi:hypothetical protein